jgi:DNA-binding protein
MAIIQTEKKAHHSSTQDAKNVVIKEINNEIVAAFDIVERIRKRLALSWKDVDDHVKDVSLGWCDWGEFVDLTFL